MEPVIRSLILKRFRSVPAERVELDNSTFLVGRNGSGKSNLVDAFSFLADAMAMPLQAVFDKRGGISAVRNRTSGSGYPPNLAIGVVFGKLNGDVEGGRYAFEVKALPNHGFAVVREWCSTHRRGSHFAFNRVKNKITTSVEGLKPALDSASLALPLVGGHAHFAPVLRTLSAMRVYSIEPAKLREMQDPDAGTSLRSDGSNATSVVDEIARQSSSDMARICEFLAAIDPNTKRVRIVKHGNRLSFEFTQEGGKSGLLKFEAFSVSDGTLRALGLLAAVYQRPPPSLVAIEEPEATIHPGALGVVLDALWHAGRNMQLVVTTHSPELLDAKWIRGKNLRIVSWHDGATRITPVSEMSRDALRDHLMGAGELLRSNILEAPETLPEIEPARLDLFEGSK